MTKTYNNIEDFITDSSFIRYCFEQNEEDVQYWNNWMEEHPEKTAQVKKATEVLQSIGIRQSHNKKLEEWSAVKEQVAVEAPVPETSKLFYLKKWFRLTAIVFLLIIGSGAAYWLLNNRRSVSDDAKIASSVNQQAVYQTVAGENQKITLPDGTDVWLNADSKLTYKIENKQFKTRMVRLIGEAYFKVSKNSTMPFIVHTHDLEVQVLGTEFNVDAYPEALSSSATLISGAVQVHLNKYPDRKIRLKSKEKVTVSNREIPEVKTNKRPLIHTDTALSFHISAIYEDPLLKHEFRETAWMEGKLVFRDEDFEALALQMSHKYGVQFSFENDSLKEYHFTGVLTNETLQQALNALQLTSPSHPFSYEIKGKQVFIK